MQRFLLTLAAMIALSVPVFAQEWVVSRVRGTAEVQVGASWRPLARGIAVDPQYKLRTGPDGRVTLSRGSETIELGADTAISLQDGGAALKTSVIQTSGTVSVDVERRNVQHFSVQTPFLAAVVKGTRFTVVVDSTGSTVNVDRGIVQVQDTANDLVTEVRPGQQAAVGAAAPLNVTGRGPVAVFTHAGQKVVPGTTELAGPGDANSARGLLRSGNVGNGNGNKVDKASPAQSNAGGNSDTARSNNSNAGDNGNNNGNGPPAHSNAGGNSSGPSENSNAGGNSDAARSDNSNAGGNGNGPPEHANAGGNDRGNGRG